MAIEFYRQIIPLTDKGVRFAAHMETGEDESQVESLEWESGVAYPKNTGVWYNNTPYISIRNVPDNAGSPDEEPDFWAFLYLLS